MVVVVVVWAPRHCWLMVVVLLLMAICGGCWWMVMVLIAVRGGYWWMVVVLMQACRWCWVLLVVCGWCCWALDIGFQLLFVHHCCLLFVIVCHCASFVGVIVVQHHFVLHGDVAADVSAGLPIGEG